MQKLCKCAEPHHISSHLIGITSLVVKNIMSNQEEDTGGRDRVNQSQLPSHQRHVTCNLLEHQIFKYQLEKMNSLYHYHSLILAIASQSLYIDTPLSSPIGHKEQEKNAYIIPRNSALNMREEDD